MSVSIITIANLGEKMNLKTAGILPVIQKFAQEGALTQVICQIGKNFYFSNTSSAVPAPLRYFLRGVEKLTGFSLNKLYCALLDRFVQWRLRPADVVLFHPAVRFGASMRKAKRQGSIVVGIATVEHLLTAVRMHTEEHKRFGSSFDARAFDKQHAAVSMLDYVIAYSDFVATSYIENGFPKDKIFVAYSDIPLPPVPVTQERSDTFKVLYIAYTEPRKGLQYLLEAWNALHLPDAELVLVGGYKKSMPEALRKHCDSSIESDPSIVWVGKTTDTARYYKDASVFVLPSLSEGNPKVVMEAMAHGLPVITTTNAKSIVEDGKSGFVVPIRDAHSLGEKIRYLYDNRDVAERMGAEARKAMERKRPFGEAVFEIYEEILRKEGKAT